MNNKELNLLTNMTDLSELIACDTSEAQQQTCLEYYKSQEIYLKHNLLTEMFNLAKERNLSLKQISDKTKIPFKQILAMHSGDSLGLTVNDILVAITSLGYDVRLDLIPTQNLKSMQYC